MTILNKIKIFYEYIRKPIHVKKTWSLNLPVHIDSNTCEFSQGVINTKSQYLPTKGNICETYMYSVICLTFFLLVEQLGMGKIRYPNEYIAQKNIRGMKGSAIILHRKHCRWTYWTIQKWNTKKTVPVLVIFVFTCNSSSSIGDLTPHVRTFIHSYVCTFVHMYVPN